MPREELIEYTDETAPEYNRTRQTTPMRPVGSEVPRESLSLYERLAKHGPEPQPKVCPYAQCENTYDRIKGEWVARPLGFIRVLESGRLTQCQCLRDRIEAAKPLPPRTNSSGRLFSRDSILDNPESEGEI